jgi:hypothetical protein
MISSVVPAKFPSMWEKALDVAPPFCDGLRSALRSLGNRASFKICVPVDRPMALAAWLNSIVMPQRAIGPAECTTALLFKREDGRSRSM